MSDTQANIKALVTDNNVVLFMKGNRNFPQCGFSAKVIQILDEYLDSYETVNVLSDPGIRSGIKEFSNWPTIPQLYVNGEFVGGCDIASELHSSGELSGILGVTLEEVAAPEMTVTPAAAQAILAGTEGEATQSLRFGISAQFEYQLHLDQRQDSDIVVESNGIVVLLDRGTAKRANGVTIDYQESNTGAGFVITNPNEPPGVNQLSPEGLETLMKSGDDFILYDVRTDEEREIATIEGAVHLAQENIEDQLAKLKKDTPIVFHCHRGGRSQQAAELFLSHGFTKVHNLAGGIDAWALDVDPDIARY